jgi:acetate kinase
MPIWQGGQVNILVVNAGSSSVKLRLVDDADDLVATRDLPRLGGSDLAHALGAFLDEIPVVDAVGHRVVHGGPDFTEPLVLDDRTDVVLEALADLAPLHNPPSLAGIHAIRSLRPNLPQVACFDTSFHAHMPARAVTYAVPQRWREEWGIRRYGFHGLSHDWASRRAGSILGTPREQLRLVTAHLGAGASLAAVAFGRSVDTTMGFTPIEGLIMATRSGSIDPGALLWVQRHGGLSAEQVEMTLEYDSGLRGLTGETGDLQRVIALADAGNVAAQLAYDVYVYRIQTNVGAMSAAMNGIDGLVFTGGAGEASVRLRSDVCTSLTFLGLRLDESSNQAIEGDGSVSAIGQAPAVLVIHAREDLEIAQSVRGLIGS